MYLPRILVFASFLRYISITESNFITLPLYNRQEAHNQTAQAEEQPRQKYIPRKAKGREVSLIPRPPIFTFIFIEHQNSELTLFLSVSLRRSHLPFQSHHLRAAVVTFMTRRYNAY